MDSCSVSTYKGRLQGRIRKKPLTFSSPHRILKKNDLEDNPQVMSLAFLKEMGRGIRETFVLLHLFTW